MTTAYPEGSMPPPSNPPSTLASLLPPLPPELEEALRRLAARREIQNAATASTPRLVQVLRRVPRTPSTDRLLAAVDSVAAPPTRAEVVATHQQSSEAPKLTPFRRITPESLAAAVAPQSEVRLDQHPAWPELRAQAKERAPDLPDEAFDRAGRWRGLARASDPDAEFVAEAARALVKLRDREP
jgi:hypothetical protein